jgi:hypothetical protein
MREIMITLLNLLVKDEKSVIDWISRSILESNIRYNPHAVWFREDLSRNNPPQSISTLRNVFHRTLDNINHDLKRKRLTLVNISPGYANAPNPEKSFTSKLYDGGRDDAKKEIILDDPYEELRYLQHCTSRVYRFGFHTSSDRVVVLRYPGKDVLHFLEEKHEHFQTKRVFKYEFVLHESGKSTSASVDGKNPSTALTGSDLDRKILYSAQEKANGG